MGYLDSGVYLESEHEYADNLSSDDIICEFTSPIECESLTFTFDSQSQTEDYYDYVYVYDRDGNEVYRDSGYIGGVTVTVPGDTVKISMSSDGGVTYYGFKTSNILINFQ